MNRIEEIVYWESQDGVVQYQVYIDNTMVDTIYHTYFSLNDFNVNDGTSIQVRGCKNDSSEGNCRLRSNEITYRPISIEERAVKTVNLSVNEVFKIEVDVSVSKLIIRSPHANDAEDAINHLNSQIIIKERARPIFIELHNVRFRAPDGEIAIKYEDNISNESPVVLYSFGNSNAIYGGNPNSSSNNHGNAGIRLNSLLIKGSAHLRIFGASGGNGENGADGRVSLNDHNSVNGANGRPGGNSGSAITGQHVFINLDSNNVRVTVFSGNAGRGGRGGKGVILLGEDGRDGTNGAQLEALNINGYHGIVNGRLVVNSQ